MSSLWRDYWGRSGNSEDYQLSYSNSWQRISYTFSASQTYDEDHHEDKRFNLFFSIPFDWGDGITTPHRYLNMSNSTTFDENGLTSNNIGLNGTAGDRDQFIYGVNLNHQRQDNETAMGETSPGTPQSPLLMATTVSRHNIIRLAAVFLEAWCCGLAV